jgi:hypothetical protein
MAHHARLLILGALVAIGVALTACHISYKLNGAAIDYSKYRTISFGDFPIRAALVYPPLQQQFEIKLLNMIEQQTRLRVVDNVNSDLRMEGEITVYQLSPQAVGSDAYATQTRLTIGVRVKYTDNVNPALSKDQTFSAYRDFNSNEMLNDVQDELCRQICEDLADLIFNATVGDW